MTTSETETRIAQAIMSLLRQRNGTICPSEAARSVAPDDWRDLMPLVREIGARLQDDGVLRVTQKGEEVSPMQVKGPIRFGRGPKFED